MLKLYFLKKLESVSDEAENIQSHDGPRSSSSEPFVAEESGTGKNEETQRSVRVWSESFEGVSDAGLKSRLFAWIVSLLFLLEKLWTGVFCNKHNNNKYKY